MNLKSLASGISSPTPQSSSLESQAALGIAAYLESADDCSLSDLLEGLGLDPDFSFSVWSSIPQDIKDVLLAAKEDYDFINDAVTLTATSSDEDQLEAYADLLGYLQPIYFPMFEDDLDDLVQDFWFWMNNPLIYSENVKNERNIPSSVKTWAIRWLQNLNRGKHFNYELNARLREEINRSAGHINLADYLDEAYNRIFSFTEKQLVSFIRKFKELKKTDKGFGYALSEDQIELFDPLFEKAQFLLKEMRSSDSASVVQGFFKPIFDSDTVVELSEPLEELLGTLFDIDDEALPVNVEDSILNLMRRQDSVSDINFLYNFYNRQIASLKFSEKQNN